MSGHCRLPQGPQQRKRQRSQATCNRSTRPRTLSRGSSAQAFSCSSEMAWWNSSPAKTRLSRPAKSLTHSNDCDYTSGWHGPSVLQHAEESVGQYKLKTRDRV